MISRQLKLRLQVPSGETRLLVQQLVSQQALSLKDEYGHLERDMAIHIYDHPERSPTAMTLDSQIKLLTLLSTLPHGVIKWSHAVPGMSSSVWLMSEHVMCMYLQPGIYQKNCFHLFCVADCLTHARML